MNLNERVEKNKYDNGFVYRDDICVGTVSNFQIYTKFQDYPVNATVVKTTDTNKTLVVSDLRKIVFINNGKVGTDFFYKCNKDDFFEYPLLNFEDDTLNEPENNELVIRDYSCCGDFLNFLGIAGETITLDQYKKIRKMLLEGKSGINIPVEKYTLNIPNMCSMLENINVKAVAVQAKKLSAFLQRDLQTKPHPSELVYQKYFKKNSK